MDKQNDGAYHFTITTKNANDLGRGCTIPLNALPGFYVNNQALEVLPVPLP
jgi:hypothetical protein